MAVPPPERLAKALFERGDRRTLNELSAPAAVVDDALGAGGDPDAVARNGGQHTTALDIARDLLARVARRHAVVERRRPSAARRWLRTPR